MFDKVRDRIKEKEIRHLISKIIKAKKESKKVSSWEIDKAEKHWLKLFGFISLESMKPEELENFKILLKSQLKKT